MVAYGNKTLSKNKQLKKKAHNKAKKDFNRSDKTWLKAEAQRLCNKYARFRDQLENGYGCRTCGQTTGQMDGGHFLPTSSYSAIRYNTNQIHQQCKRCNRWNGGMRDEYTVFMIDKYGEEYVANLKAQKNVLRSYSVEYYVKLIKVVSKKLKRVEKKLKELS